MKFEEMTKKILDLEQCPIGNKLHSKNLSSILTAYLAKISLELAKLPLNIKEMNALSEIWMKLSVFPAVFLPERYSMELN